MQEESTEREEGVSSISSPPQMARLAPASPLCCARSSSVLAAPAKCEGDKLIGGFGFWVLGPLPANWTASSPFRLRALGARAEVDRAQPQAEAADEMPGGPTRQ